jgi:ABC-type transporter Mla subunit MlaD
MSMFKPSSRRAALAVGALLVLIAAVLASIAYQQRWLFSPQDRLYVEAPDATGMTEGMQVTTRGVVVGSVRSIALPGAVR